MQLSVRNMCAKFKSIDLAVFVPKLAKCQKEPPEVFSKKFRPQPETLY